MNRTRLIAVTIVSLLSLLSLNARAQQLSVTDLRVEYRSNPVGIDEPSPRLSWKLQGSQRNVRQTAYKLQVAKSRTNLKEGNVQWQTDRISSDRSTHVPYEGPDLRSGERYFWRVRVWDNHGHASEWSDIAFWEMGLLHSDDWNASWITPNLNQTPDEPSPAPMLRDQFALEKPVESARAYVTSHGLYEMKINGERVGDRRFTPGWTSYDKRLSYQTYDVTNLLHKGENAVGVMLGDGWYRGDISRGVYRKKLGNSLKLLAQISVTFEDGKTETFGTDASWKASTGPIRMSRIYDGEVYDARKEKTGWTTPGYVDDAWTSVSETEVPKDHLVGTDAPPVRNIQEIPPKRIITTPEGNTVVDMGQNMVGHVRLAVEGPRGTKVTLQHAEVLTKEQRFYTKNLRDADQEVTYILKGEGREVYEPHFTFQGFRYVKVEGYPGELTKDDLTGVVVHSNLPVTGHVETSHPLVNQLQHNIVWSQKGNFLDIPTDCPQRNERLGWTGDIQPFIRTAARNMQTGGFLKKWLSDLKADQHENGSIPSIIPNVMGASNSGQAAWADAGTVVPWWMYREYGDKRILKRQYSSMKAWVEYVRNQASADDTPYLWDNRETYGDWLAFHSSDPGYPGATTDKNLICTAFFARSTDLVRKSAKLLDKQEDAEEYAELFEKISEAFQKEYVTETGRIVSDTQTAYALALRFNLLSDPLAEKARRRLAQNVEHRGHVTTGFVGTPHINPVLTDLGRTDLAYNLLTYRKYPSWLYPVAWGATTIWERWDGIKTDWSFQDPGMNSFNHFALGSVGEWLYSTVAGIRAASPGYKTIRIQPEPGGGLTHARGIRDTMQGRIVSSWTLTNDQFTLEVQVPANTNATIVLPRAAGKEVTEGGKPISDVEGLSNVESTGDDVTLNAGSGSYVFQYTPGKLTENASFETRDRDYSIATKTRALLADARTRKILFDHLPKLMNSPWLSQVMGFPLNKAVRSLPERFQVADRRLNTIQNDLNQLSAEQEK